MKADTDGHTGCVSTDGKHAEQANPETQGVGSWWSGAGEGGCRSFEGMKCSGIRYDGCTGL